MSNTRAPSTINVMVLNSTGNYNIPFEYLARKFVVLTLLGRDRKVLVLNQDYRFTSATTINLSTPYFDGYDKLEIRRETSATDRLVDYHDGSILRAYDLNLSQLQTLHVAEEARDLTADNIGVNDEGNLDARGRKIVNIAAATDRLDAVSLGQLADYDTSALISANKATESAEKAMLSEVSARESKLKAQQAATSATSSESSAINSMVSSARDANRSELAANRSEAAENVINTLGGAGFTRVGTFKTGATLTNSRQTLLWSLDDGGDGHEYGWAGDFPKDVVAGSSPTTSGGISDAAWMSRWDPITRYQVFEALRRSYAEIGYNLVSGSFEQGGVTTSVKDALLLEANGRAYAGVVGKVPAGTNPVTSGWTPIFLKTLREEIPSLVGNALYGDIRGYTGTLTHITCVGKNEEGDGAGGEFFRDDSDTTSADNGVITLVDALGRRWRRDHTAGLIHLVWATGRIRQGVSYTAEFEAAVKASARTNNENPQDMRAGTIMWPSCDVLLRNARVTDPGLVIRGVSNGISRIVGDIAGTTLTVQPLRGGAPYTNTGYGGLFLYDIQIVAVSDAARQSGTGLLMVNCFNTQALNQYVAGFFFNILLRGSHFTQFRNFYAADEKSSLHNPNEEIFNRGYAIAVDPTQSSGEFESTGLVIDGGWLHNTSLDLGAASSFTVRNIDIEPASNSVRLGHKGRVHDNRFERMDYYAVNATPPKYSPFPWFIVSGDGNLIERNEIHSLGASNNPAVNPKFKVEGNDNRLIFDKPCIHFGLIHLDPVTKGNHVEIGRFEDLKYFNAGAESPFYVENVHIYEGENTFKLIERRSHVESHFDSYSVVNCQSVKMAGPVEIQGLTKSGKSFSVTDPATCRVICNFNSETKYAVGMYCLKFRMRCYSDTLTLNISGSYTKGSAQSMTLQGMNEGYSFVRFQVIEDTLQMTPTFTLYNAKVGDSFTLSEVELLKFDSGEYVKGDYVM